MRSGSRHPLPVICRQASGAAAGLVVDLLVGDGPLRPHPVAVFGRTMSEFERWIYQDRRWAGVLHAATGVALGATAGKVAGSTEVATYVASAPRGLFAAARSIHHALDTGDLAAARALLPTLAGRDPELLDADAIARAVVESIAESTVDAIVAPAFWALVAGAPGAGVHRAVNTLDSMVGHRDERYERFGWASARLDDALAYVPARATACLVAACRPLRARDIWEVVRRDAPAHPSPNAGVAEAAFAAALGLTLGGTTVYDGVADDRPHLGAGRAPNAADIAAAIRLGTDVTVALVGVLAGVSLLLRRDRSRR